MITYKCPKCKFKMGALEGSTLYCEKCKEEMLEVKKRKDKDGEQKEMG